MYSKEVLMEKVIPIQRCSFCSRPKDHADVDVLVASRLPGVHICQICVGESLHTIFKYKPQIWKKFSELVRRLEPTRVSRQTFTRQS